MSALKRGDSKIEKPVEIRKFPVVLFLLYD